MITPTGQLLAARTDTEIVAALYRGAYRTYHKAEPPEPGELIPEGLAAWMLDCPVAGVDTWGDPDRLTASPLRAAEGGNEAVQLLHHVIFRSLDLPSDAVLIAIWWTMPGEDADTESDYVPAVPGAFWAAVTGPGADSAIERAAGDVAQVFALVMDPSMHYRSERWQINHVHAEWCALSSPRPRHPLAPLVAAWQQRPRAPEHVHLLATQSRRGDTVLTRMPGLLALATADIETVEVDGEPLVTPHPDGTPRRRYRIHEPKQGELWPAPRKLDGRATAGAVLDSIAQVPLTGDARKPLRAQMIRAGTLGYALTAPMRLTLAEWTKFLTGRDTPENREAALTALRVFRYLEIDCGAGPWSAFDAELGPIIHFGPPRWWMAATGPRAHRLTGALFRRIDTGPGRKATRWGALERTIAGLEGALLWSAKSAGKGRYGRLPDSVRPVARGKAGAPVFVPWWLVLRLSGEHLPDELRHDDNTATRRYRRRMDALRAAGYFLPSHNDRPVINADAPAGDTIEIVRQVKGGRGREAGIQIRATARFCAAYAGGEKTRIPARNVLTASS